MLAVEIPMYLVYERPRDYPDEFVARVRWIGPGYDRPDPELFARGKTLGEIHARLPEDRLLVGPHEGDDPSVLEAWMEAKYELAHLLQALVPPAAERPKKQRPLPGVG